MNEATGSVVTVRAKKRDVSHKEKIRVVTTKKTKRVVLSDDVKKIRKEFELDEPVIQIAQNKTEGTILTIRTDGLKTDESWVMADAVFTFVNDGESTKKNFQFQYDRIFKCIPEGIESGSGIYNVLIERAFSQRAVARAAVKEHIQDELATIPQRDSIEQKKEKILEVISSPAFQKRLRAYVYFDCLMRIMLDSEKYRQNR